MSPGVSEREFRWGQWFGIHDYPSYAMLRLAGFEHQCGGVTRVENFEHQASSLACSACRFEIQDPVKECKPLWGKKAD